MKNKVLCLVPLYNKINFLPYSIGSILNQEDVDITMVIVDDGSTDGSYEWVQEHVGDKPNVHVLKNDTNLGCYQTRNRALKHAIDLDLEFDYFTVTDPDDSSIAGRFATTLKIFKDDPLLMCIKSAHYRYNIDTKEILATNYNAGEGNAWFTREVFDTIGYWDNTLKMSGDTEYIIRLSNLIVKSDGDWKRHIFDFTIPQVYCMCDNEMQNLTALYDVHHPQRRATFDYIDEFTAHCKVEDCYYGFENTGHPYSGMGAPSIRK